MAGGSTETVSMAGSASVAEKNAMVASAPSLVCVECGRPVARLFREYNMGNIRLGRCEYCRSVADKYIECEFVLIAIDLALHRVQAYRHLLFNRKPFSTHNFHGRLWQLGVAMAALDAHLRHTALSSEAALDPSRNIHLPGDGGIGSSNVNVGGGDPFWEAGGLLLTTVVEHACFAAGAVLCARRCVAVRLRKQRRMGRKAVPHPDDNFRGDHYQYRHAGDTSSIADKVDVHDDDIDPGDASSLRSGPTRPPSATKMYMALVYPLFFRLLAAFVMIWDRQLAILNTIELLVATMQFVALSAVVGGPAEISGMGEGGFAAAAVVAGLASKMGARGILCFGFGGDPRTLTML